MGEQTQAQTQIQPQPQQSQPPLRSQEETIAESKATPVASLSDPTIPTNLPHNPSVSSKIPVRPHKLRKLSSSATDTPEDKPPQPSAGDSSKALVVSNVSAANDAAAASRNRRRSGGQSARALPYVLKPLSAEGEIDVALHHLRTVDPLLVPLIDSLPAPAFEAHHPPFVALTRSILYQQLAYKAGTSIYTRFVELCGGEDRVLPETVLALSAQQLRQIGVSARKATYLFDLANKYNTGILSDNSIVGMDDKSLFTMLSMVKGIGSWSVHMFMIFSLHRPDVLPVSDVGVRKGVQILHGLEDVPRPSQMEQLCEKWRPYRSVGSWYMWRLIDGKGNPQAGAALTLEGIVPLQQQMGQQEETQQQHQLQLLEPIGGTANFGGTMIMEGKEFLTTLHSFG
ncbi:alkylbase DNA glycosidase-like protein mag2 [Diospyros lotus]|uniref:alkylbase DNA glycosidase-like protein mag2 n=1 Tax=Diospyros lotus TaxID=55363 RepID=UPI00224FD18F|nr:alkylbase DNA glycosidase-like protein mag2 [Diospyros lotus]